MTDADWGVGYAKSLGVLLNGSAHWSATGTVIW